MTTPEPLLQPPLRPYPSKLFVEVTTRCNLNCFMCVKQQAGSAICEGDLTPELFARLEPAFPHLQSLILNGIGEPLLNPHLEEFIRIARRSMPAGGTIGFQTNGLLMTNLRAIALVAAGVDRIAISVDASSPERFREVREGGELLDIEHAFRALAEAKKRCDRPDLQIGMEFVVMRSNLAELPAALRWGAAHGASFAIVTHMLPYSEEDTAESAYSSLTAEARELFQRYREEATRQGLDIDRYFAARWKYSRTAAEQELVVLVEKMKREAQERNLFIDMKRLLQRSEEPSREVAAVFARAREVAADCGLELRLPEVELQEQRHCSFVEEGGAFVSWEGKISPCYFLWHRYQCWATGWSQEIQPKVFGSLQQEEILAIWQSAPYRTFREEVITYDYPTCASCSLAPCDYVQSDHFAQDCHIKEVPCGACLWCMGVFQCLQ